MFSYIRFNLKRSTTIIFIIAVLNYNLLDSYWDNAHQKTHLATSYQVANYQTTANPNNSNHVQTLQSQSSSKIGPSYTFSSRPAPQQKKIDEKRYTVEYTDGRKEIVDQARFEKELQKAVDLHIQHIQNYFGCHVNHLTPTIKKALQEGTINTPETQNKLLEQTIHHLVNTNQTEQGIVNLYRNHLWVADKDFTHVSDDKKIIINYAIARMACCTDSKTIELAQTCLQHFDDKDYDTMHNYQTLQSYNVSNQTAKELNTTALQQDFITVLNQCTQSIDTLEQQPLNDSEKKYLAKLYQREAIIIKTLQNSPCVTKFTTTHFALPPEVAGYLMAHNINYATFNNQNCIYFQHLLTNQIIDILKTNVGIANKNLHNDMIAKYIYHTCNLAVGAQQLNQEYQLAQATLLTDLSEIATIIGQSACQLTLDLAIGIGKGTFKSLQSWLNLAQNLCVAPIKTTQEGIQALVQTAQYFGQVIQAIDKHAPHMNIATFQNILDSYDDNNFIQLIEDHPVCTPLSEQYKTLKTNINMAIDYSIPIIETILNRPAQENIADLTQCVVDGIIINKIGLALSYLANFGKAYLTQVSQAMCQTLPEELLYEPLHFATTPTGDMIAYVENTGEPITEAIISSTAEIAHATLDSAKYAVHAKNLSDYIKKATNADQKKIDKLQAMFEKYYRHDVLLPGLEKIEGVKQIDAYRAITHNFQDISKLTPTDIMYLNMCNGLYPYSIEINELVKKSMLYVTDLEGNITYIKEFDIFHSFLGEMRPNATSYAKKGGHMLFPETKFITHKINAIIPLKHGYFDIAVKHIVDKGSKTAWKTQFPLGSTPIENAQTIIDLIKDLKEPIKISIGTYGNRGFKLKNLFGQYFQIFIENEIAQFYPISSNT